MNETSLEKRSASQEQVTKKETPQVAGLFEMIPATIAQIKEIEGTPILSSEVDCGLAHIGERVNADASEIKSADDEVHFQEQSKAIAEKQQRARTVFEDKVCRALLPVATAFALSGNPAFAQEINTEQSAVAPEIPVTIAKAEKKELVSTDIFDNNSPLGQSSEIKKKTDRAMTPEELDTVKDFQQKAWEEKNEWMVFSGIDKGGKYMVRTVQSGSFGGYVEFENTKIIVENEVMTHTHPLEMAYQMKMSAAEIRDGDSRAFMMPPSSADIGTCMDDTHMTQRVIDPRGMWEYRCDENSLFNQSRKKAEGAVSGVIEGMKMKYKVEDIDFKKAVVSSQNIHPAFMLRELFNGLESKYPGIQEDSRDAIVSALRFNNTYSSTIFEYEAVGTKLLSESSKVSDEENAKNIATFIKTAEKNGIYISYTPFKERLKIENRKNSVVEPKIFETEIKEGEEEDEKQ